MISANEYDCDTLLSPWRWRVPGTATPLFLSGLGDWVFGDPNGSLWALSMLDGDYFRLAHSSEEYNRLNKSTEWLNATFAADWLVIGAEAGLIPAKDECLGWRRPPRIGGAFATENLKLFSMRSYQIIMGQLHESLGSGG
jgi:hypothetical protein